MKSIQTKFIVLIVSGLVTMALLVGGIGIWSVSKLSLEDSEVMLNATCTEQTQRLNEQLNMVEQSVTTLYSYADRELDSERLTKDKEYMSDYTEGVRALAVDISNRTKGAIAVYFRYNPDLTGGGSDGFFWCKDSASGEFTQQEITDLFDYPSTDVEHVGWYYIPVSAGKAIWMEPYYNDNLHVVMISYVIPFYRDDRLIAVVGMDVDFSIFVDIAQDITLYDTGKAELACLSNKMLYYRKSDDADAVVRNVEFSDKLYSELSSAESNTSLDRYVFDKREYKIAFQTLSNGMKVVVYASVSEINAQRNRLFMFTGIVMMVVLAMIIFVAVYITRRIVHPLRELNEAAERFAKGDWDISIRCYTRDEVKSLTDSITKMAEATKSYIQEINKMAYQDGLTGVKNKSCYFDYVTELVSNIKADTEYAVLIFDVNCLKWINDTYGHERGDRLIVAACKKICNVFVHSPVFRLGGDEFAVILSGKDFAMREELLRQFKESVDYCTFEEGTEVEISVALGMAVYPVDGENYESVFHRADERMYNEKKIMKHEMNGV